jgi:hypothetical protein
LSKLFDQLKNAARSREKRSPGVLLEALQNSQQPVAPDATTSQQPGPQSSHAQSSYAGIALAVLIFAVAVLAWNAAPWRAPLKHKIDPSGLKLDRSLDLQRAPSKGTSPPGRPS